MDSSQTSVTASEAIHIIVRRYIFEIFPVFDNFMLQQRAINDMNLNQMNTMNNEQQSLDFIRLASADLRSKLNIVYDFLKSLHEGDELTIMSSSHQSILNKYLFQIDALYHDWELIGKLRN